MPKELLQDIMVIATHINPLTAPKSAMKFHLNFKSSHKNGFFATITVIPICT